MSSYGMDDSLAVFSMKHIDEVLSHVDIHHVPDYHIEIEELEESEKSIKGRSNNLKYSLAGFRMILRGRSAKYVMVYYVPLGLYLFILFSNG